MTINRSTLLDLPLPVTGTEAGTWGDVTNNGLTNYLDIAIAGMNSLTSSNFTTGALTIALTEGDASATNIAAGTAQYATIKVSSLAQNSTITAPASARSYRIINADATYNLIIKASGQTGVTFLPGTTGLVAFNGTDYEIVGVVGPASATDNAVVRFDSTTGQVIQNSGVTIDDSNNVSGVAQLNATTADLTNIEVTNIKAKDGTASATIADSTGKITVSTELAVDNLNLSGNAITSTNANGNIDLTPNGTGEVNITKVDIDSGVIDGTTIGANSAAAGTFTNLTATTGVNFSGATVSNGGTVTTVDINGGTIDNTAIGGATPAAGAFTTLSASSTLSVTGAGTIQGLTVGRGAGAIGTNTAVGASALAANVSGSQITAVGYQAARNTTGANVAAFGSNSGFSNTTGTLNAFFGTNSGYANTTGGGNTALGEQSLFSATTPSNNTAAGYASAYSTTTGTNLVAVGMQALYYNTTGGNNTALGRDALYSNTTASNNTAVGYQAGYSNTTGTRVTAFGVEALRSNTTGSFLVAVGYQAAYSHTTGQQSTYVGDRAGYSCTVGGNTFIGAAAGYSVTTGTKNTFIGGGDSTSIFPSGYYITTGSANTILGNFSGNQGGLDIRTGNNNIVLSDGDGNPRFFINSSGYAAIGSQNVVSYAGYQAVGNSWGFTSVAASDANYRATFTANYSYAEPFGIYVQGGSSTSYAPIKWGETLGLVLNGAPSGPVVLAQGQLQFPATQVASSGANTLDDYEQGTFTLTATPDGGTITLENATAYYVKIGRVVHITGTVDVSAISSPSGNVYFTAPFTCRSEKSVGSICPQGGFNSFSGYIPVVRIQDGQSFFYIQQASVSNGALSASAGLFTATTKFEFTITYFTDD